MSDPVQKSQTRTRGRPRAYDPESALKGATRTFWRSGFAGSSLDELCDSMDMNRPSLYGAFGDKRDLYLATLERYVAVSRADMERALAADLPLAKGLQRVYDRALALYFADAAAPLGCFLIGTAATEAARDRGVRDVLGSGLRALSKAFEARFRAARKSGEIASGADPKLLAELAASVLFSIALRARAGDSRASLAAFSRKAVTLVCGAAGSATRRRAS
ncbi:MAG: TetR/AcrR family transcriptional regulator [Myxococcota bacterium]